MQMQKFLDQTITKKQTNKKPEYLFLRMTPKLNHLMEYIYLQPKKNSIKNSKRSK